MQVSNIKGEARISLKTLFDLQDAQKEAEQTTKRNQEAIEILGEFLQFLKTKDYFKDIQEEFNASHDRLSIKVNPETKRVILLIDGKKIQNKNS